MNDDRMTAYIAIEEAFTAPTLRNRFEAQRWLMGLSAELDKIDLNDTTPAWEGRGGASPSHVNPPESMDTDTEQRENPIKGSPSCSILSADISSYAHGIRDSLFLKVSLS